MTIQERETLKEAIHKMAKVNRYGVVVKDKKTHYNVKLRKTQLGELVSLSANVSFHFSGPQLAMAASVEPLFQDFKFLLEDHK